jgi:hypothetical protein
MIDSGLDRRSCCGGRSLLSAALLGGRLGVNHLLPLLRHPPRPVLLVPGWCVSLAFRFTCAMCLYMSTPQCMCPVFLATT